MLAAVLVLPFPTPGGDSGRPLASIHTLLSVAGEEVCANHSCGAVADFHRASRTFWYGTKVEVGRLFR